jgi:hypothetical protein
VPNIRPIPVSLQCRCGESLFEGTVTIGIEGDISSYDFLVGLLNVTCPTCLRHCRTFDDDFTRALDALESNG